MKCPKCGQEMERGSIGSETEISWFRDGVFVKPILRPTPNGNVTAYRCLKDRMVLFEYR